MPANNGVISLRAASVLSIFFGLQIPAGLILYFDTGQFYGLMILIVGVVGSILGLSILLGTSGKS